MSPRGVWAISAAMAEWALWRVHGKHDSDTRALIEAMWVIAIHPSYLLPYPERPHPPISDPGWKNQAQSTFWHIEFLHRKVAEQLIGYNASQDLRHWCLHVIHKAARPAFDRWVFAAAQRIAELSPGDPDSFAVATQQRPEPDLQAKLKWGRPVLRQEMWGEALDDPTDAANAFADNRSSGSSMSSEA